MNLRATLLALVLGAMMAGPAMAEFGSNTDRGYGMADSGRRGDGNFTTRDGRRINVDPSRVTPRRPYDGRPIGSRWGRDYRDDRGSEFDSPHGGMGFGRDDSEQGD